MNENKLMLLPGLDGTGKLFEPLLSEIQNERTIEVISYPDDKELTYSELLSYVDKIIQNENSIYIIAESFSGSIALKLLKKHKNIIKGIILIASFITPPSKYLLKISNFLPVKSILKINIPNFLIRHYCLGYETTNKQINQFKKNIKLVNSNVLAFRLKELLKLKKKEHTTSYNCKIIYIQASNDKLVSSHCLKELSSIFKIEIAVIKGSHFLLQTKPIECADIILKNTQP